jgi:hypothetical protein
MVTYTVETNTLNKAIINDDFLKLFVITCCPDCVEFQSVSSRAGISAWDEA